LPARIVETVAGSDSEVDLKLALGADRRSLIWARLTARSAQDLQLGVGRDVFALIKAVAIDRPSMGSSATEG
jgi:molybdate transport system ATP-binding protein